jgi:membrane-associated phospholipid phosphatase
MGGHNSGQGRVGVLWAIAAVAVFQLAVTAAWIVRFGFPWTAPLLDAALSALRFTGFLLAATGIRAGLAHFGWSRRFDLRSAFVDAAAFGVLLGIVAADYTWLKLMIPALNGRSWDSALGSLDRLLCGGIDPNRFLLTILEGNPRWVAFTADMTYWLWLFTGLLGALVLLTASDRTVRRSAAASFAVLWLVGVGIYVAVPAFGPALVDIELWTRVRALLPNNAGTERDLLRNYMAIKAILAGTPTPVRASFGVAAMPSLHVAVDVFLALWASRQARWWAWVWWILAGLTAIGAVATGWHYVVDVIAGAGLAVAVYAPFAGRRLAPRRAAGGEPGGATVAGATARGEQGQA